LKNHFLFIIKIKKLLLFIIHQISLEDSFQVILIKKVNYLLRIRIMFN
jgi:hypothetical protein